MAKFSDLSKNLNRKSKGFDKAVGSAMQELGLSTLRSVITATPVDTGRARSNWQTSLDSGLGSTIEAFAPGVSGSTASANTQAAIDAGFQVVRGFKKPTNQTIHITNNLPYISRLNEGSSAQAPANFIEMAVQDGREMLKGRSLLNDG